MHSQNDEEKWILEYFKSHPIARFLDIGAHDGVTLSNTRALAELGWGGTLVEPSAIPFRALMDIYRGRDDIHLANIAIVPTPARIHKFHDSRGDFVSTFDEKHRQLWAADGADGRRGVPFQPIYVAATTIAALVEVLPGPYAFVNLDVEGINCELFKDLPLRELGVEMICVEYQDRLTEIEAHAATQGYVRRHVTSENVLLVDCR